MMGLVYRVNASEGTTELRRVVLEDLAALIPQQRSFLDLCSRYRSQQL